MKAYTVIGANEKILRSGMCQEEVFEAQALNDNEFVVEGQYSPFDFYRKNGEFHRIPAQPSKLHVWDETECVWKATKTYTIDQVRLIRNAKLRSSDWTDTVSAQTRLDPEVFQAWQTYRQALRDITDNIDLSNVTWPVAPAPANPLSIEAYIEKVMYE